MDPFMAKFLGRAEHRLFVLDVGAGDGRFSKLLAEHFVYVDAIEPDREVQPLPISVIVNRCSLEDWFGRRSSWSLYDAVLVKNVLQFMDHDMAIRQAMPMLMGLVGAGGLLGIETFYAEPSPLFEGQPHPGIFSQEEIVGLFRRDQAWHEPEFELSTEQRDDVDGIDRTVRTFHFLRVFARKRDGLDD